MADRHAHHDHHHALIAERRDAWARHPRRSGRDRHLRREAGKRYLWTLIGHLRCCHGWRGNSAFLGGVELERLHEEAEDDR